MIFAPAGEMFIERIFSTDLAEGATLSFLRSLVLIVNGSRIFRA